MHRLHGLSECNAGSGSNISIAASCFGRVEESADRGLDEDVIRSVTATVYIGKTSLPNRVRRNSLTKPRMRAAASDTVRMPFQYLYLSLPVMTTQTRLILRSLFLVAAHHPQVVKKAQK